MKKHIHWFLFLIQIIVILFITFSFTLSSDKGERIGMFQTYADYVKGKPTAYYDNFETGFPSFKATINGKYTKGQWANENEWGFQDSHGYCWHLDSTNNHHPLRIMLTGKIWLYTDISFDFVFDANGKVKSIQNYGGWTSVWVAEGVHGKTDQVSEKILKTLFADDADLLAKLKDKGIYNGGNADKWFAIMM